MDMHMPHQIQHYNDRVRRHVAGDQLAPPVTCQHKWMKPKANLYDTMQGLTPRMVSRCSKCGDLAIVSGE
jgi:hypothetical protein